MFKSPIGNSLFKRSLTGWSVLAAAAAGAIGQTLEIKDYTGRGFAPDLVHYQFDGSARAARRIRLSDADGNAVPAQVTATGSRNEQVLSFVASVPPDGTAVYRVAARGPRAASEVSVGKTDGRLEVGNAILAIRMPGEIDVKHDPPVAARTLPAPVLAFRGGDDAWRGGSRILTERPVARQRVRILEQGPVFVEVMYELEWADGGYYRAFMKVIDQVPLVKVREEYDLGALDGTDFWELDLAAGWAPDKMEVARTHGNGSGIDRGRVAPLAELSRMNRPRITPDTCPPSLSQLGLFREADQEQSPGNYPMAGVVPLRKGEWRKMNAILIATDKEGDARIHFPMTARHAHWIEDTVSETSPFSMIEHEPGLSRTYGRRLWGLVLGAPRLPDSERSTVRFSYFTNPQPLSSLGPFAQARSFYGVIGLDRYKDYLLDWPDTGAVYPRLYDPPGTPTRGGEGPDGPTAALIGLCNAPISCPVISHHLTVDTYVTAAQADATLARPDLPDAVRREMRARLALIMYLFEEPDFIGYGNGAHSGNPNMGTSRYMGANAFLPLLPDHPMFERWRDHVAAYTEYKMATQIAPEGAYLEFGSSYHMHGYARTTCSLPGLISAGATNAAFLYEAYHRPDWDYFMNLLTPVDRRYGTRMIPGLANAGPGQVGHFRDAAGSFARTDPDFASAMMWAWRENGAATRFTSPWIAPTIPATPQKLSSRVYPGFGAILRAHQGPDETYLLLRSGFNWSHWYIDQGHMVAMSRGAVLLPYQSYAYYNSPKKTEFDMHNIIRFGHPANEFPYDWTDGNILEAAFGPTVDYLWASTGFPDWFIEPGVNPELRPEADSDFITGQHRKLSDRVAQTQGAFEWNRQVIFLKGQAADSPNYFVIRDSVQGEGRLAGYFFLNLLGKRENLTVDGNRFHVDTASDTQMEIHLLQSGKLNPVFHEENQPVDFHHITGRSKEPVRDWVDADGNPLAADARRGFEQRLLVRVPGEPGGDLAWVIYPIAREETRPEISSPAPGVVRVAHREGTDTAFLSPRHFRYESDGMVFEGCAGSVRERGNEVTLALTAGRGTVEYRGHGINGTAPIEKTFTKPGVVQAPEPSSRILPVAIGEGGTEIAPGIVKLTENETTRYAIAAATPVLFTNETLGIEALRATIEVTENSVRFIVPDPLYARLTVGNVGLRGVGPFDLTFTRNAITGRVDGRTRSLVTTWPEDITRPAYYLDGVRYFAGWADDHCIGKGTAAPQFAVAFGVTDGLQEVAVLEWEYPPMPPAPPRQTVAGN